MKKIPYYNKETPFEIQSEEDWRRVKKGWYFSYICNECGERHVKTVSKLKNAKNTCINKIPYYNKETPFEIKCEEDWRKVKQRWWVSYMCNKCGKKHVKHAGKSKYTKNTCLKIPYYNKETPFEIKSEEDWKKVKCGWYVSYICNICGDRHVKIASKLKNAKNTCINKIPYYNKETPFEIKCEKDWKKVKKFWYVSYMCNKCGKKHVKYAMKKENCKNTCLNKIPYTNKETPFEIKSEEDWKKVKGGWYVSYICNTCGRKHVKVISGSNRINTCLRIPYRNKETPFEIKSEEDWKKVKGGWYVSYMCNKCGKKHVKIIIRTNKDRKNTCIKKRFNNIKINYKTNNVDRFIFAY